MSRYFEQREITNRLQADRQRRCDRSSDCGEINALLEHLSPHLVMAIAAELNGEDLLTQYRVEDEF